MFHVEHSAELSVLLSMMLAFLSRGQHERFQHYRKILIHCNVYT